MHCNYSLSAHLSRIVSNKTYSLFHLESFCEKSPLPGKLSSFPPLVGGQWEVMGGQWEIMGGQWEFMGGQL